MNDNQGMFYSEDPTGERAEYLEFEDIMSRLNSVATRLEVSDFFKSRTIKRCINDLRKHFRDN